MALIILAMPLRIATGRLVQPNIQQLNIGWQLPGNNMDDMNENVLARGLVIHQLNFPKAKPAALLGKLAIASYQQYVVESVYHLVFYYRFELAKIHDHTVFGAILIGYRCPNNRNSQSVRMSVYVSAGSVVPFEHVSHFKIELLGQPYFSHNTWIS